MSLGLSPNVKIKIFAALSLFVAASAYAGNPYSNAEIRAVETADEAKIREIRDEEITQLRVALGRRAPQNRQADLYYRLAEIYVEAYRSAFLIEGRAHDKRIEKQIPDKTIDRSHSRPYLMAGVKACQAILQFRIAYPKLDQIYYFLGFYYGELEDIKQSTNYFKQLVQQYPGSVYAGVAYKELGEDFYHRADYRQAQQYFEKALDRIPREKAPPILHKLAWTYFRTKQYGRSISVMKEVISLASQNESKYLPLKDEATRDIALMMTETGNVNEAIGYFKQVSSDSTSYPKLLEKMGEQYERNADLQKAIQVYESLLKTHPESDSAFRVTAKLIELDIKKNQFSNAINRLKNLRIPDSKNSETQVTAQNLKVLVRKTATDRHQAYRKKKSASDLVDAQSLYSAYLDLFLSKDDPHHETSEIQMYLAEVLREQGKSREEAELYSSVIASKDKRYFKEASNLWSSSLANALKKAPSRPGATAPSELEKQFIESADLLAESEADLGVVRETQLHAAQVFAGYAATRAEAIHRVRMILQKWPQSAQGWTAAQLLLQIHTDQKSATGNSTELNSVMQEIRSNPALMASDRASHQGKLKAALEHLEERHVVETIAKQEKSKDFLAAAKGYEEFASSQKDRNLAEKAYANAIHMYLSSTSVDYASILAVADQWTKRYPGSSQILETLRTVATNALILGNFQGSAQIFERLGTEFKDPDSLETSAKIFDAVGDSLRAQQNWAKYLDFHKRSPHQGRVALSLALSQEKMNLLGESSASFRRCASSSVNLQAECESRLADLYLQNKDVTQAKLLYKKVASLSPSRSKFKKSAEATSPFVGYARYKLAEMMEKEATFEPLRFPKEQLQKALNQRMTFLGPLSQAYQSAVQVSGPWAVAALNHLALWASHFADEVDAVEPPASLEGVALEKFKKDLKGVSGPLKDQAKSIWNEAYSKAISLGLLSPALPEVADHLADFRSVAVGRAQGARGHFELVGISLSKGSEQIETEYQKVRDSLIKNAKSAHDWTTYGNLLWGEDKPLLAKLAYERALALNPRSVSALNNLAVMMLNGDGEEDWLVVAEANHYLERALEQDHFYVPAKINLATLLNYYRSFSKAHSLWEQVLVRNRPNFGQSGLAVSLQGVGKVQSAVQHFEKANIEGSEMSEFVVKYHEAARNSTQGVEGAERCISLLSGLNESSLIGFEKQALIRLRGKCDLWKRKY
jgi:tetratricopeptide (TPR) repeat protein